MRGKAGELWWGVVLESPDANALARFYSELLGWPITREEPGWVTVGGEASRQYLAFNTSPEYVRPVWPPAEGKQQMMMHLDIEVDDLEAAVDDAIALGATPAEFQPQETVRVMLDPAGHPFCLYR